jgi:Peptidase M50B-like
MLEARAGMHTALVDFECTDEDGRRRDFVAGVSNIVSTHEIVRRYPHNFAPEGSEQARQAYGAWEARSQSHSSSAAFASSSRPTAAEAPTTEKKWSLGPSSSELPVSRLDDRAPIDRRDFDVARTARHEAGHAAAAYLLGWEVTRLSVRADGDGFTGLVVPTNRDRRLLERQRALILFAGPAHSGGLPEELYAGAGYTKDNKHAYRAIERLVSDPRDPRQVQRLAAEVRQEAEELAKSDEFRFVAKYLSEELLDRGGHLRAGEVEPVLREASRAYRRTLPSAGRPGPIPYG